MCASNMCVALVVLVAVLLGAASSRGDPTSLPRDLSGPSSNHYHYKANGTDPLPEIQTTLDLLQQGEKVIELNENYKDIILMVGNTGAGTSTLTQWLAGDSAKLRAAETRPGSGKYIIVDTNGRNQSTIKSKTIYPKLVIDNATKTAFYDLPGFSDNMSTSQEIAASYFNKRIINNAKRIKIVFVVTFSLLRKVGDKQDLLKFLKHGTELVRNIEKFRNSITLVVTKVVNYYSRLKLIDDETVKRNIADFLKGVRKEFKLKYIKENNKVFSKVTELIDVFLTKEGNSYENILLFRSPDDLGFLNQSVLLINGKSQIRDTLLRKITFTKKNNEDFGFTISEKSTSNFKSLVLKINTNILLCVSKLAEELKKHYRDLFNQLENDIKLLNNINLDLELTETILSNVQRVSRCLNNALVILAKLVENIKTLSTPKELSNLVDDCLTKLNITGSQGTLSNIWYQGDYVEFLEKISIIPFNSSTAALDWAFYFDCVVNELTGSIVQIQRSYDELNKRFEEKIKNDIKASCKGLWVYFLNNEVQNNDIQNLFDSFTEYFNKLSIMQVNLRQNKSMDNTLLSGLKFSDFILSKIVYNRTYFNVLKNEIDDMLKYLENTQNWYSFLNFLYERLSEYDIQKDMIFYYANASDITLAPENVHLQPSDLESFLKTCCYTGYGIKLGYNKVKEIVLNIPKVEALKKVIYFTLKHEMDFNIEENGKAVIKGEYIRISELLWMTNQSQIKHFEVLALEKIFIDDDWNYLGKNVTISIISPIWDIQGKRKIILDGLPGEPHTTTKAKNAIYHGASGYDGEQGKPGDPGGRFFGIGSTFINGDYLTISANGGDGGPGQHGGDGMVGEHIRYRYLSSQGQKCQGGNGGKGGAGGAGGNPGFINIISLSNNNAIIKVNQIGKTGPGGTGGQGGAPGRDGIHCNGHGWRHNRNNFLNKIKSYCKPGERGLTINGSIDNNVKSNEVQMLYQAQYVNSYKTYMRQSILLHEIVKESTSKEFLDTLEISDTIRALYDVYGFLNDFISLERQFTLFSNKLLFLYYYKIFINRIDIFVESFGNANEVKKYKRVFKYLRMTTLIRIYSIENNIKNYMVTDISKFLILVKEHIDTYEKTLKEVETDSYIHQYKDSITSKINVANYLIDKVVSTEIDNIYEKVDTQIKSLIDDIVKEHSKAVHQRNDLIEKKNALANQMIARSFLGSFKLIGISLSFLGPWGILAGGMIGIGAKIAEDNLEDIKISRVETYKELPQVINYYKREKEYLKNNLNSVAHDIKNTNNSDLQTILNELKPLQILLNSNNVNVNDYFKEKLKIKSELSKYLKKLVSKQDILEKDIKDISRNQRKRRSTTFYSRLQEKNNIESKAKAVSRAQNAITIAEAGYDYLSSFGNDNDKVAAVEESIHLVSEKITQLKEYEQTIYNVFIPMRSDFENSLKSVGQFSSNKPHAVLDIGKWKIQNIVKDFQTHIQYMVQVSDPIIKLQLKACIEKLQDGMQTMLQIYDRIQTYNDHAKFAEYLATLRSEASVTGIEEFSSDIHKIDLMRQSILILQEYEKASSAFIQHVYPFAGLYLDHLEFSPHLQTHNISDLVYNAAEKINFMRTELTMATTVIKNKGYTLFPNIRFDSKNIDKEPFFVWEYNGTYKDEITLLLQGQEVTLEADIHEGVKQNAIKFNEIGIRFISANTTLQSELDVSLRNFLVRMTHVGKSYFRCDDKYHVIRHSAVSVTHSASSDPEGHYRHMDEGAAHLARSTAMCSPYTTWRVQLETRSGESVDVLSQYSREAIDVALEGWGQYVKLGLNVCNDSLEKYYKEAYNQVLTIKF